MSNKINDKGATTIRGKLVKFLVGLALLALVAGAIWINYTVLNYFW